MKTFIRNLKDLFFFNSENYYLELMAKELKAINDSYKK